MLDIVKNIKEKNLIPCLASVSDSGEEDVVGFQGRAVDMSSAKLDSESTLSGIVRREAHREGAYIQTMIPHLFDPDRSSGEETLRSFTDFLTTASRVHSVKPVLVEGMIAAVSELPIVASDESIEERLVWSSLHNSFKFVQFISLWTWDRRAGSVMGEEAVRAGFKERLEAIEQAIGDPPLGEEVGGTV